MQKAPKTAEAAEATTKTAKPIKPVKPKAVTFAAAEAKAKKPAKSVQENGKEEAGAQQQKKKKRRIQWRIDGGLYVRPLVSDLAMRRLVDKHSKRHLRISEDAAVFVNTVYRHFAKAIIRAADNLTKAQRLTRVGVKQVEAAVQTVFRRGEDEVKGNDSYELFMVREGNAAIAAYEAALEAARLKEREPRKEADRQVKVKGQGKAAALVVPARRLREIVRDDLANQLESMFPARKEDKPAEPVISVGWALFREAAQLCIEPSRVFNLAREMQSDSVSFGKRAGVFLAGAMNCFAEDLVGPAVDKVSPDSKTLSYRDFERSLIAYNRKTGATIRDANGFRTLEPFMAHTPTYRAVMVKHGPFPPEYMIDIFTPPKITAEAEVEKAKADKQKKRKKAAKSAAVAKMPVIAMPAKKAKKRKAEAEVEEEVAAEEDEDATQAQAEEEEDADGEVAGAEVPDEDADADAEPAAAAADA